MTDKEQIINDSIDTSCCDNYSLGVCRTYGNVPCDWFPDCAFKQLARKTQECEELKEENEELKAQRDAYANLMNVYKKISMGRQDCEIVLNYIYKLKQKIKVAKEALQYYADGEDVDEAKIQGSDTWRYVVDDNYMDVAQQALSVISEVNNTNKK